MNYSAHYYRLICRARSRALTSYKERHHVVLRNISKEYQARLAMRTVG